MNGKGTAGEFSIWTGHNKEDAAHLAPVAPPRHLEINGSPIVEQSHEYVIRKPVLDAED